MTIYEDIGKLAVELYNADLERIKAKKHRASARDTHRCRHEEATPCYYDWRLILRPEDWCDNCKYVQPFHVAYTVAAHKVSAIKSKINKLIKQGNVY